MSKAGLLESPKRNLHLITERGRQVLAEKPAKIGNSTLATFQGFNDWRVSGVSVPRERGNAELSLAELFVPGATPEEEIERAFRQIQGSLEYDLLDRLQAMHPVHFERLILDLLKAMGYGAGSFGKHEMTKASADGGIDGIIHEDALGLDAVYIQAKRYQAETKVGRPAIQQFIGSLTEEGATKGVFVTTSDFSADARR
jgi:restriction system protein